MAVCWYPDAMRYLILLLIAAATAGAAIVQDVRAALGKKDWAGAEALIKRYRSQNGVTPEMLVAHSWLGRAALAEKRYDDAERYAAETKRMVLEQLKTKSLDKDPDLPIALGAAIEVQGHVLAGRGERDQAVEYLKRELKASSSPFALAARTQKNIHLLSLEGKPFPKLDTNDYISTERVPSLKGKPVLFFLWAHWCSDCKQQGPILARIRREFEPKGLVVVAPTQFYGYAEAGRDAGPDAERKHIQNVLAQHYQDLRGIPMPLSSANFRNWGVSSTPTLVLVNRQGIVTMYHPGRMTYEELAPKVQEAVTGAPRT
jgi:thiol-disulfide isomerase/thioredoxin